MSRRKDLTLGEKLQVIQAIDEKKSQNLIAQEFEVSQSTISRIAKNREHIITLFNKIGNGHRKRKREGKSMDVEIELLKWYHTRTDTPITSSMMLEKSKEIALNMGYFEFRPTMGWLQRWKERNNLVVKKSAETILPESPSDELYTGACLIEESLLKVLEIYQPEDIFNCKETGLYYNAMPECFQRKEESEGDTKSNNDTNDRMTLLLCCNMAGSEKMKPLIICNNTTVKLDDNEAPVIYKTNNYGLMTTDLFTSWLEDLDKTMEKDKRQICMILSDCDEHTSRCQLNNVRLVYVPPGTTSFTHPLNHGIIQNFKALYRQQIISKVHVEKCDEVILSSIVKLGILDSIYMLSESWDQVKQTTVQNCFVKSMMGAASVSDQSEAAESDVVSPPQNMTLDEFNTFINIDDKLECFASIPSPIGKLKVPQSPSVGEMLATIERKVKALSDNGSGSSPPLPGSTPSSQLSSQDTASPINLAKEKPPGNLSNSANSSRNQSPVLFDGEIPRKKSKLDIAHRLMNGEDKSSSPKLPSTSNATNQSKSFSSTSSSKSTPPQMVPNMATNPFAQLQMLNMMQHQLNPLLAANSLSPGLNPFVQGASQNPSPQDALLALGTLRQYLESRGDEACLGAFYVFDSLVRYNIMRNLQQRM